MSMIGYWLPRFQAAIPVSVYVNGRQVPPIEAEGEITSVSAMGLQLTCSQKIPIPAKGILRFTLENSQEKLEMKVNFVQRTEGGAPGWFRKPLGYVMKADFLENPPENEEKFKTYFHHRLFGDNHPRIHRIVPINETNRCSVEV